MLDLDNQTENAFSSTADMKMEKEAGELQQSLVHIYGRLLQRLTLTRSLCKLT